MTDNDKNLDPIVVDEDPTVDVDTNETPEVAIGIAGNTKYITIGISIAVSVLIYFFAFSGNKEKDIIDPNAIVVDNKPGSVNNRATIDDIDSIINADADYNGKNYVNNADKELLELPKLPALPETINENIEQEIKETKKNETNENTFTKEEVDELINSKLKSFEDQMNKMKNESEKLAKELERKKLEEEESKKKKKFSSILGSDSSDIVPPTLQQPGGIPPELNDITSSKLTLEEQKEQEERELKIAQRARIMEERKTSPMFKMQGGGGGNGTEHEQDSIIITDKDSLENVEETKTNITTTKTSDMSRVISQGKVINAILETAINTDIQTQVRAVVSRDIYSQLGKNILIPKGSRLIGNFQATSSVGVSRLNIVWTRVIRSDGLSINLNASSADNLGRGGVEGELDNKYTQVMRNAFLSSMITIASAALVDKVTDTVSTTTTSTGTGGTDITTTTNATNEAIINATKSFTDEMKDMVDNLKEEKPTIRIAQGTKINVVVNQDLILPIYKQKK